MNNYIEAKYKIAQLKKSILDDALKGGPTSGNYGHGGRPGERGGSTPGGGHGKLGIESKKGEKNDY